MADSRKISLTTIYFKGGISLMKLPRSFARLAACFAVCSTVFGVGAEWAQSAEPAASNESAGMAQLEEVVVTAQKRSESLEKIPVAVSAVSGQSLQALGITSAVDLTQVVPDLAVGQNGVGAQVAMRGVVSTDITEGGDPAVAFNVDGAYLARPRAALTAMYDVNRVEVLRGPQGTLYGRNSIAGAINVITNKPDLNEGAAEGSVQYGNYNELQTYGMVNIPVSSTFGLRAAFQSERHDGYSENAPSKDYNDLDAISARVEGLWQPIEDLSVLLSLDSFHNGGVGGGSFTGGAPLGFYATNAGATPYRYAVRDSGAFQTESARGATLTVDWKLPLFAVTYVGNYRADHFDGESALAVQGPHPADFPNSLCTTATDPSCFTVRYMSKEYQTSHELRLSNETDRLKWLLALYYFGEHNEAFSGIDPCPCGFPFSIAGHTLDAPELSRAVFSQATWSLTQNLRFTGGVRYNSDFKGNTSVTEYGPVGGIVGTSCVGLCFGAPAPFCAPNCPPAEPVVLGQRYTKLTWKAALDYDLSPNSLLFATVATGYKAGGLNGPPINSFYQPESITNYEVGSKNEFLDKRLQVNVDVFHALYSNYQATSGQLIGGSVQNVTVNAGKAKIDGVELETVALLTPLDRMEFNATYLNARFTSFPLPHGDGFNNYQPEDLSGNNLTYAPRETARLSYQHTFPIPSGASIVPRIDSSYVGAQDLDYHNFPVAHQVAYTRTGLSLSYNAPKIWSAMLFVHNLENKAILATTQVDNAVPLAYEGLAGKGAFYLAPRTYGIKLSARF